MSKFRTVEHKCDLCVVGGGLAGMCAAVSAARHGLKVVIMQDRPMFGGNASSEIRMWVSGAHGDNNRETGIIEEIALENMYRNPERSYPIWDSVLFEIVKKEENITTILNCSCLDAEMKCTEIVSILGWQTTTQMYHKVYAKYFADCSGDSVLAPLSDAEYRIGREGRDEFGESIAPINPDKKTMGMSCLIQARETDYPVKYTPPKWANKYTEEDLPYRLPNLKNPTENFWYMELGGENDSIADTEEIRDELLKVAYGIWDFVKNSGKYEADNWTLSFVGFLPGKRESRRYVGDHIITQNEVADGGNFSDTVAFGGWTMDDHHPGGISTTEKPNIFHPAPSPFGIPYRALYSANVVNLFFAGRNISATHAAMSATRVMGTCALLGQAVGTAAAVAKKYSTTPRGVSELHIDELKQMLMEDDCYLPKNKMQHSELIMNAKLYSDGKYVERLINGHARPIGDEENAWVGKCGDTITVSFDNPSYIEEISLILDSDLNRENNGSNGFVQKASTLCNTPKQFPLVHLPKTLVRDLLIEAISESGEASEIMTVKDNKRRLLNLSVDTTCCGIRITPLSTYGCKTVRIFSLNIK